GPARRGQVEESAIEMRLRVELGLNGGEEVRGVQAAVEPAIEHGGAGREIEGCRDGYRGRHRGGHAIAQLAQPLEDDVPAQRGADQAQAESRLTIEEAADHEVEVSRVARVIEAAGTIHLAAAGAKMDHEAAPAHPPQATEQPQGIAALRRALETMEHDDERRPALTSGKPVEFDEVAVRRLDSLAEERRRSSATQQRLHRVWRCRPRYHHGGW